VVVLMAENQQLREEVQQLRLAVAARQVAQLTFSELRRVSAVRAAVWQRNIPRTLTFAATELAEEVGEVCGAVKRMERKALGWPGGRDDRDNLAEELADVVITADLMAHAAGIDLAFAVAAKFNRTSEKYALPHRLRVPPLFMTAELLANAERVAEWLMGAEERKAHGA
jgi:NTP pyrophosphatase (non-canonical NTP hydrolase)